MQINVHTEGQRESKGISRDFAGQDRWQADTARHPSVIHEDKGTQMDTDRRRITEVGRCRDRQTYRNRGRGRDREGAEAP